MKISPIITSTLITAIALWFVALYDVWPIADCSMGMMKLPFMLGMVPPITGVLSLPTFLMLSWCEKNGISNKLLQTGMALLVQMPLSFIVAALVTPIEGGTIWHCMFGG